MIIIRYFVYIILKSIIGSFIQRFSKFYPIYIFLSASLLNEYIYIIHIIYTFIYNIDRVFDFCCFCFGFLKTIKTNKTALYNLKL